MNINQRWIMLVKRLAASWISLGFWLCALVFYTWILVSLYLHRGAYAEGLLPELIHFPNDGLTLVSGRDVEHAMTVFFILVLYFGISVALLPLVIHYCWRLRRELKTTMPASPR